MHTSAASSPSSAYCSTLCVAFSAAVWYLGLMVVLTVRPPLKMRSVENCLLSCVFT